MKQTFNFIWAVLTALTAVATLSAETVKLRNTAGNDLTAEIISVQSGQLTFNRASDKMEFTIPLSMLDEPSRQKIADWEVRTKYLPDTAPFFKLNGEYVIPVEITGNQITYFDSNSRKQTVSHQDAPKLQQLVDQNKKGLAYKNKDVNKLFTQNKELANKYVNTPRLRNRNNETIQLKETMAAIFNVENRGASIKKEKGISTENEPELHEITYEIFTPQFAMNSYRQDSVLFISMINNNHPLLEEIREKSKSGEIIPGQLRQNLPDQLTPGKWNKNKAIIRTYKHAENPIIFQNKKGTPVGVRNLNFKPVEPNGTVITLKDLINGYNLFTSTKPFEIKAQGDRTVKIVAEENLEYHITLDPGYEIEITIEYENGNVTADDELFKIDGKLIEPAKKMNLKSSKKSFGSRKELTIQFNSQAHTYPEISLKPGADGTITLQRFDVSIKKDPRAAEKYILHR